MPRAKESSPRAILGTRAIGSLAMFYSIIAILTISLDKHQIK